MFRYPKDVVIYKKEILKKDHEIEELYSCDFCNRGPWPTEAELEIHRKVQHKYDLLKLLNDATSYTCSVCLRPQADTNSLIEHIKSAHLFCSPNATKINREIFICDYCHNLFFNKDLLVVHMHYWHTQSMEEKKKNYHTCPKCWKTIQGKAMWYHFLNHGILSTSTCPICLIPLKNHSDMLEHVKKHSSHFSCNKCSYETPKEVNFNSHREKHKKNIIFNDTLHIVNVNIEQYFLPLDRHPLLTHRLYNYFRGIPLTVEVKICVLCRELCVSDEEMRDHINGDHAPEQEAKSKTYFCMCGEQFFNSILLKHHVFKLKGNHKAWDGVTPLPVNEEEEEMLPLTEQEEELPLTEQEEVLPLTEQEEIIPLTETELVIPLTEQQSNEGISLDDESEHQMVYQIYEIPDSLPMDVNEIIIRGLQTHAAEGSGEEFVVTTMEDTIQP